MSSSTIGKNTDKQGLNEKVTNLATVTVWRRLPTLHGSAVDALVGAEAMLAGLETTGQPAMRWYVVKQPALILGSSQRPTEIDADACRRAGVTVHRRRSGGSTVYTDGGALSLDVALPAGHPLLPANVTATYRWFGEVWAAALDPLGVDARVLDPEEARPLNAALDPLVQRACYGGVSPYEVCVGDRKIVGLAQVRRRQGAVLQAGMYLRWEPEQLVPLLAIPEEERALTLRLLRERAVGLHDVIGTAPSHEDIIAAWERAFRDKKLGVLNDAAWTDDELAAAQHTRERYANLLDVSPHREEER